MPVIAVLPELIKNQIAAGEVVERPASVLRELIENSIDAQAAMIDIAVERAGAKLIRVADDGVGMSREDALLCVQRHATSKLRTEEDLYSISTMGFRGEALPSIASVSHFTLTTAPRGETLGTRIALDGGALADVRDAAAVGTTIEVRDLFFNTPARKKFLKSPSTELMHMVETATKLALSHPKVGFRMTVDGQLNIDLPRARGHRERLTQLYGAEFMEALTDVDCGDTGVMAFISRHDALRDRRTHQFVFINDRPVRDPSMSHAVYTGFEGVLPKEKHPVFFLFLRVAPGGVDFNVHPAKREVRFTDKEAVYRAVVRCVREAFMPRDEPHSIKQPFAAFNPTDAAPMELLTETIAFEAVGAVGRNFMYLGEMFVAFVPEGGGISIMDHHAAHERVLYERMADGVTHESLRLLFPRQVRLSTQEHMAILKHRDVLEAIGLQCEDFGHDTLIVRAVPDFMEQADLQGMLSEAAHELMAGDKPGRTVREAVAMRLACHASVRGTAILGREALEALLGDLKACRQPQYCPHGRPTVITYATGELRKLFKRK